MLRSKLRLRDFQSIDKNLHDHLVLQSFIQIFIFNVSLALMLRSKLRLRDFQSIDKNLHDHLVLQSFIQIKMY